MLINTINLNHLLIFETVYRTKSMTRAAEELHMTQSGVSQHIKHLEEVLDIKLFDRIKQKLIPTQKADYLYKECSPNLYSIEKAFHEIKGAEKNLAGTIAVGIPIEFGNSFVLPLLAEFGKANPEIKFKIRYGLAPQMNEFLLDGTLDFAFVDSFSLDKHIKSLMVYQETFELCAHKDYLKAQKFEQEDRDFFERLEYVDYSLDNTILSMWFKHHFSFKNLRFNVRASLFDVEGIFVLIQNGLGAGILPGHLLDKSKEADKIVRFKGKGKPLLNEISVAFLEEKSQTPLIKHALKFLTDSLKK